MQHPTCDERSVEESPVTCFTNEEEQGLGQSDSALPLNGNEVGGTKRDQRKPFSIEDESFDSMISYRVRTEGGRGGNNFAEDLRKEMLHITYAEPSMALPSRGPWPKFARSQGNQDNRRAKVYLDAAALKDGEEWEAGSTGMGGFIGGVACSIVFVPLLSARSINGRLEGSLGGLVHLQPQNGMDYKDNVLLEFTLALETKRDERFATQSIFPIFVSEKDESDGRYKKFSFAFTKLLSDSPSAKTNDAAAAIMQKLGFDATRIAEMRKRSVRQIVNGILAFQGMSLSDEGVHKKALEEAARRVLAKTLECIANLRSDVDLFRMSKPQAEEVLCWLEERGLSEFSTIFARHELDSLLQIRSLDPANLDQLAFELASAFSRDDRSLWLGLRTNLGLAVEGLGKDVRARSIADRLETYADPAVGSIAAAFSANFIEISFSKLKLRVAFCFPGACLLVGCAAQTYLIFDYKDDMQASEPLLVQGLAGSCVLFFAFGLTFIVAPMYAAPRYGPLRAKRFLEVAVAVLTILGILSGVVQEVLCLLLSRPEQQPARVTAQCETPTLNLTWPFWFAALLVMQRLWPQWLITFTFTSMGAALALLGLALLSSAPATGALLVVWGCVILSGFAYMLWLRVQAGRLARMLEDQDLPAYKQAWQEALEHGEEVRRREGAVDPTASAEMERRQSEEVTRAAVHKVAEHARQVNLQIQAQHAAELRKAGTTARAMHWLRTGRRVGRFHKGGSRVMQDTGDIETLFIQARTINDHFQSLMESLVEEWAQDGLPAQVIRGPVKQTERALQKCVRVYRRDPAYLADLVRCTVVFRTISDIELFLRKIEERAVVGLKAWKATPPAAEAAVGPAKIFRIMRMLNRFDPEYNADRRSSGYRDMSLHLEVGWTSVRRPDQKFKFEPLERWGRCQRHVCEVQLLLQSMHNLKVSRPSSRGWG